MVIAFVIGMHDGGGGKGRSGAASGPSRSPSESANHSGSPSPSGSAGAPSADGMTSFIRDYIDTAVSDPASAFQMLTPQYQEQSHGLRGYESFWGEVSNAKILSISADPDALKVSYRYRYNRPGGPTVEDVTLRLTYQDGTYLIAGEA
jgi:hypothetical protein